MMRAKMVVTTATQTETSLQLHMSAVGQNRAYNPDGTGDEDNTFSRWTPCADVTMTIQNPELLGKFAPGDKLYVDFTPAQ